MHIMSQKTWGGRFSGETDNRVEAFTESISFDRRLYRHDIRASQAHARMLAEVSLLTAAETESIVAALDAIAADIERGDFTFSIQLEDIHTHIERALIERLGDVGRKLHTGRSRNDQVVTDVKLWVRDALDSLDERLRDLQRALLDTAERNRELVLPGYTHLQRAQPVLAAHYFLAYIEKYQRDRERLVDCRKRVNVLPRHISPDRSRQRSPSTRLRCAGREQSRCVQRPRFPDRICLRFVGHCPAP
jgi:argininosuccinate lyase